MTTSGGLPPEGNGAGKARPSGLRTIGYVAGGVAALLVLLAVSMCGLAAMLRQYREFTVPLALVLGGGALALGVTAYFTLSRRE
jgi:hypothetical protein